MADGEPAAEIYPAATQRDQAAILFRDAKQLAESSPAIASRLHITEHNLAYYPTRSFCRAVSKQHRGLDGKRVHYGLLDELHEHPDAQVVNKMRAGTKSRRQPIIFEITNSGYDRESVCWRHHQHSVSVLDGFDKSDGLKDESWFAYVCQLDCCEACLAEGKTSPTEGCPRCDDWRDEAVWIKANPGLDVILPRSYLRERVAAALAMPADQSITKRLNFCVWVEAAVHGIPLDKWDACRCDDINEAALEGRTCYLGLDIGAWDDFTALAIAFPDEGEGERVSVPAESPGQDGVTQEIVRRGYTVLFRYWMPEHAVRRDQRMTDVIASWQRAGWITVTPGDVVDYERVRDDIVALSERFGVRLICFDQGFQGIWIGSQLVEHFGAEAVYFLRQGMISLNVPFRELLETIVRGQWRHGGDPVTRWMAANCQTVSRGGLIKPSKDHSAEKIDAVLAMTMALAAAIKDASNPDGAIWYSRGCLLDRG